MTFPIADIPSAPVAVDALIARMRRVGFVGGRALVAAIVAVHRQCVDLENRLAAKHQSG